MKNVFPIIQSGIIFHFRVGMKKLSWDNVRQAPAPNTLYCLAGKEVNQANGSNQDVLGGREVACSSYAG